MCGLLGLSKAPGGPPLMHITQSKSQEMYSNQERYSNEQEAARYTTDTPLLEMIYCLIGTGLEWQNLCFKLDTNVEWQRTHNGIQLKKSGTKAKELEK